MKKHILYVYGTLRPGVPENRISIPGAMFSLGGCPGVKLGLDFSHHEIICERVEVDSLDRFDRLEGYREHAPETSFYIRCPLLDGWIYEYNGRVDNRDLIESGDWLAYRGQKKGSNSDLIYATTNY